MNSSLRPAGAMKRSHMKGLNSKYFSPGKYTTQTSEAACESVRPSSSLQVKPRSHLRMLAHEGRLVSHSCFRVTWRYRRTSRWENISTILAGMLITVHVLLDGAWSQHPTQANGEGETQVAGAIIWVLAQSHSATRD